MIRPALIGEMLIAHGLLSHDQLRIALMEQKGSAHPLGKLLVQLGFVSDAGLREILGERLGHATIDLSQLAVDLNALHRIPRELARRHLMVPVSWNLESGKLILAMVNPDDLAALDQVRALMRGEGNIEVLLASETDILNALDQYYGSELCIDGILHEIVSGEIDYASLQGGSDEYSQPVVRLVDALLVDGVVRGASDLHFEPEATFVRIRYRVDGVLREIRCLHKSYWPAMVVRLKVICGMNIAEVRAPQDGRLTLNLLGRPIDFRAASHPGIGGENFVMRVLDRQKGLLSLEGLQLSDDTLTVIKSMLAKPEGLILLSGPTGSGKTTTLYSMLGQINTMAVNIMTLEDPVEYPMPLLRQTNMGEGNKMDFASGIRSMMRQDPDVILVGEIRDRDTAEMALRAAMTGHQVYSTLHSNSAIGAIPRLLEMGMRPEVMAGSLIGIVGQRLVRRLCLGCRQPYSANKEEQRLLGHNGASELLLYKARGCNLCDQQGYRGRISVLEVLKMDDELNEMVARHATTRELLNAAVRQGFRPLAEEGLRRVAEGTTSIDEIARVINLETRVSA